jgi:hypothetical protein
LQALCSGAIAMRNVVHASVGWVSYFKKNRPGLHTSKFDSRSRSFQIVQKASMTMSVLVKYFLVSAFVNFEA